MSLPDLPSHAELAADLEQVERRLRSAPEDAALLFRRAYLFDSLGYVDAARRAYLGILSRDPTHFEALINLGSLAYRTGSRSAALTAYRHAVLTHPNQPVGHLNYANALYHDDQLEAAAEEYQAALRLVPDYAQAHQGYSQVLARLGDMQRAKFHRERGFRDHALEVMPYFGEAPPVAALVLHAAAGGNVHTEQLFDDRVFQRYRLVTEYWDRTALLPACQVVFNAIGDADQAAEALHMADEIIRGCAAPVINLPARVLATSRVGNAQRFADCADIVAPSISRLTRADVSASPPSTYPVLLRTPGHHTGRHFVQVRGPFELQSALATLPDQDVLVIQYVEARGSDGRFRKYRVMFVDGAILPLHLAVSEHWKVHYFSAANAGNPAYLAEEARFLQDMPGVIGARAVGALEYIRDALGLDYAGVDFGVDAAGRVVLYEANATMVLLRREPADSPSPQAQAVERVFTAVHRMLLQRALGERAPEPA